jgi:hypothetical protein
MLKRASSTGKACSLDDISEDTTQLFTLSSPRSAEALACHGMLLEDLQYRPLEEYKERGVPHEVASLRYEHNEAGRRERIKQVKHEYRVICGTPGTRTWNGLPFRVHEDISLFLHLYLLSSLLVVCLLNAGYPDVFSFRHLVG